MGVYARHNKLWLRYTDRNGKLIRKPTPYVLGQERFAEQALEIARAIEESEGVYTDPLTGVVSVERYARQWLQERESTAPDAWKTNRAHLELHILPRIGGLELREVRPRHLIALFADLRRAPEADRLSPKSLRNVYGTLRTMLRDALIADLIISDPCVLTSQHLGPLEQRDPVQAEADLYTRAEVERLISASEIDADRRLFYAVEALAGLRLGEVAGLRWKHYDPELRPLGRLTVATSYDKGRTKTRRARYVPVHPTLAAMLAEWRLAWPSVYGRDVEPDALILGAVKKPGKGRRAPTGAMRTKSMVGKAFRRDLAALELVHRRGHDLRSTFISLAEGDGADRDKIEDLTHTSRQSRRGAFEGYLRRSWPTLCAEVAKLKISRREPAGITRLRPARSTARSTDA